MKRFDPNSPAYRSRCCHVRTVTVIAVFLEMLVLSLGIAHEIYTDTSRLCDKAVKQIEEDEHKWAAQGPENQTLFFHEELAAFTTKIECSTRLAAKYWAFLQIAMGVILFFGIKANKWELFVPHLVLHGLMMVILCLYSVTIIFFTLLLLCVTTAMSVDVAGRFIIIGVIAAVIMIIYLYFFVCIMFYCEFLKLSHERRVDVRRIPVIVSQVHFTTSP